MTDRVLSAHDALKIELLQEARSLIADGGDDFICSALLQATQDRGHGEVRRARLALTDYIEASLAPYVTLEGWMRSRGGSLCARPARLAWIDAMIESIRTGEPVKCS